MAKLKKTFKLLQKNSEEFGRFQKNSSLCKMNTFKFTIQPIRSSVTVSMFKCLLFKNSLCSKNTKTGFHSDALDRVIHDFDVRVDVRVDIRVRETLNSTPNFEKSGNGSSFSVFLPPSPATHFF